MNKITSIIDRARLYGFKQFIRFSVMELQRIQWRIFLNSYSQHKEDLAIDKVLGNKESGFYVDIGAYDPIIYSNTARFYKKGWNGINLEPNPTRFNKLEQARKRDINLNLGVGLAKKLTFYSFENELLGTFSKVERDRYVKMGFKLSGKKEVKIITLESIFDTYAKKKRIDFLSIDTEGLEMEILKSNNWKKHQPKLVCIETYYSYPDYPTPYLEEIDKFLKKVGYKKVVDVGQNSLYLLKTTDQNQKNRN